MKRTWVGFIGLMVAVGFALPHSAGAATPEGMPAHRLADLSPAVDHPFVPLASVPLKTFTGEEIDPETGEKIALRDRRDGAHAVGTGGRRAGDRREGR